MRKTSFLLATILLSRLPAQQPAQAPPKPPVEPIPLTQIALRSEELSRTLRDISRRLPLDSELATFEEQLLEQEQVVRTGLKETSDSLAAGATSMEIREQVREWKAYGVPESRHRKTLSAWGAACEESIGQLNKEQAVWQATLNSTKDLQEVESVLARIRQALAEIQGVKDVAEERLRIVVDLQGRVSKQALAVADILEKLNEAKQRFQGRLLYPDAQPIWRVPARRQSGESLGALLNRSLADSYSSSTAFVQARPGVIGGTILFLALAFAGIRWFSRATLKGRASDPAISYASRVLGRPISLAVLVASPVVLTSLPLARMSVALWLILLFLLPIARLLPLFAESGTRLVYFSSAFYALNGFIGIIEVDPSVTRELTASLFAAALLVLAWWGRPARFRRAWAPRAGTRKQALIIRGSAAALAVILVTNVFGFLMLSNLFRMAVLLSSYIGLVMYTLVRVSSTLFAAVLRSPRLRSLATMRLHEPVIVQWTNRVLRIGALMCWIYVTLDLLAFREEVFKAIGAVLNARIGIRAFSISLGDIFGFVSILVFGYLAACAIRFILREEILSHLHLSRGVPELISTSFHYVLLLLVFFMSLSAAGVQLDKLTVLTGAFGVGVGFGMQNVVNNFVSGLILQFERPIRIGDIVEAGGVAGEVRRMGVRASTIHTFLGAEVIIPNSAFISNQVTNWTLSEPRRRVDIEVRVAYGTGPERVIEILSRVAGSNPNVLREPAPGAFFQGFGPSALEFVLMFWAEQSTHFRLRSEISIAINAALREAGIEIPFPQQDVRVRYVEASALQQAAARGPV